MRHLRSDYDAIQPWPVKRPHIAKQGGRTVRVPTTVKGEFDQTWKNVNGPLWGTDFEKRPGGRDNFPRGPYGSGR